MKIMHLESILWLAFITLLLPTISSFAQEQSLIPDVTIEDLKPATLIEFEEMDYNFGEIEEGTIVSHVFTFTNRGDEPLNLLDAKGSCGCTVPKWPRGPIQPGETASITVKFNSKNKSGVRNQKVVITANTTPPQTFLYLKGTVVERTSDLVEEELETEEENPNCFAIYPNPTADRLVLDMKNNVGQTAIISIQSLSGQVMARREVRDLGETVEFQVGHYPAGTYYAHVQVTGEKAQTQCFLVAGN